jgi:hypothetical protein
MHHAQTTCLDVPKFACVVDETPVPWPSWVMMTPESFTDWGMFADPGVEAHPRRVDMEGIDMAELPKPTAARLGTPSWRDTRLVVGVVLVLLSMAIGAKTVAAAGDTVPMYAASSSLVPGQPVTQRDVKRVDVQLGADRSSYVAADHDIGPDTFALRDVRPGELVPRSALGQKAEVNLKPVSVPVDNGGAAQLDAGSIVDVWVNAKDLSSPTAKYGKPVKTLTAAPLVRRPDTDGRGLGAVSGTTAVQIMVPEASVEALIAAIDQGAKITLVPVPGSPTKAGG